LHLIQRLIFDGAQASSQLKLHSQSGVWPGLNAVQYITVWIVVIVPWARFRGGAEVSENRLPEVPKKKLIAHPVPIFGVTAARIKGTPVDAQVVGSKIDDLVAVLSIST
jgi:hypothetical protein